jgi:hypothetical protein
LLLFPSLSGPALQNLTTRVYMTIALYTRELQQLQNGGIFDSGVALVLSMILLAETVN